ncbi:MAG: indoleamine 2,3-dioxygenase [Anaerolineae bacterium]|jgi:indoleamine 2,3-dioxygenase|nr:indoleamine 2,3-dioxygenase [Anaerolineae bacterium]
MKYGCWDVAQHHSFLLPNPIAALDLDLTADLEEVAADLPFLLRSGKLRSTLTQFPVLDLTPIADHPDDRVIERLMQIYCFLANAYVYADPHEIARMIPAGVAIPLTQLAAWVERPPVLSYSSYVLANWQGLDDHPFSVDHLRLIQPMIGLPSEAWFILIHVEIERHATQALIGLQAAITAVAQDDPAQFEHGLSAIHEALRRMIETFKRMPEGCSPEVYYHEVRPYIFGLTQVIFEGVSDQPHTLRGGSGAQSAIVPTLVAALDIRHESTGLTEHLDGMRAYMPKAHREWIASLKATGIRAYAAHHATEVYNAALRRLGDFRKLHFYMATSYITNTTGAKVGTGGTVFENWLRMLITETEQHLL